MKNKYYKVLDDGFIGLKDYMGTDEDIEQAARVSYGKGTRKVSDTRNLIRYLMRHRHSSPLEMASLKFHMRMPIYVARQLMRHRTFKFNEYSGRYSIMIDSMEKTNPDEWRTQSKSNKQGSSDFIDDKDIGILLSNKEETLQDQIKEVYQERLDIGIAKEQARKDLPVSNYTEMYVKCDLRNLLGFMSLRSDHHAQIEIRKYSNIMGAIVAELFPITFEAWVDYDFCASNFTAKDKQLLWSLMQFNTDFHTYKSGGKDIELAKSVGMGKREVDEFWGKFELEEKCDVFNIYEYEEVDISDRDNNE